MLVAYRFILRPLKKRGGDIGFPPHNRSYCRNEIVNDRAFEHETLGPGGQTFVNDHRFVMDTEDDEPEIGAQSLEQADDVFAGYSGMEMSAMTRS
jgi:hypothetical protein